MESKQAITQTNMLSLPMTNFMKTSIGYSDKWRGRVMASLDVFGAQPRLSAKKKCKKATFAPHLAAKPFSLISQAF